jgi:iron complex outermembrane receptor protein
MSNTSYTSYIYQTGSLIKNYSTKEVDKVKQKMMKKMMFLCVMALVIFKAKGQTTVTGSVTNVELNPLHNVSVHLLNTNINTLTDKQGNFKIPSIPDGSYTIELSSVGYATVAKVIEVNGKENKPLSFQLNNNLVQLGPVTVTAEKKEELLQNIPLSITAISSKQVEEYRLWNVKDLTAIVPNLYSGNSGDERNVMSIRGITTTSYDPSIATYVDGVNQFSLDTYIPQLVDIERIEILRGPQGTLYGRNAMGGVINIITKQPTNYTNGFAEVTFGNYNQQRYSAGIRTPIIKNKLFFGASGVFSKRNGYYFNDYNNTTFDKQNGITGNGYLKYLPSDNWTVTLNFKFQNNKNHGAFPMVNSMEDAFNDPYKLNQNAVGLMTDNTMNTSLSLYHLGTNVDFTSQTAWQNNHRYYNPPIDGDFSPYDIVTVANNYGNQWNNVKVFTQEFKLNSSARKSSAFNWTAGAYFFHQYNPNKQATQFGADAGFYGAAPNTAVINTTKGKNTGFALYGQVDYTLTKKLSVVGGLRYDYENKYLNVEGEYQTETGDIFVTTPDTSSTINFNAFSPKLGLKYALAVNSNLFANYSRGFRTGGLTQLSTDPSQPPLYPYQPEYSNNYEIGIKNNFLDYKLVLNVTAFYTHVNNAQVPTLILPDAITVTKNTGELNSKGAELEAFYKPVKGLQFDYSFGYTNAKYKSLKLSSNGENVDLGGKTQIFTPDVTSMLTGQYSFLISARHQIKMMIRGEWFYLGRRYFDLSNNISQAPYSLLNTMLGVSRKNIELSFWMRNIGDVKYIEYAYDFGAIHLGTPMVWGISLKTRF